MDDLFVTPEARGTGAADALILAVGNIAKDKGWGTVRWITADDNFSARSVYDRRAERTMWITYDMKP